MGNPYNSIYDDIDDWSGSVTYLKNYIAYELPKKRSVDIDTLEELIQTAVNQAVKESQEMVSKAMSKVTGGMKIPGLF